MLQNKRLKQPAGTFKMVNWKREVCDDVIFHLVLHDGEGSRPVRRDESHHVCDVSREQHAHVYIEHMFIQKLS